MCTMKKGVKSYLKPQIKIIPLRSSANICAGSGNTKFLNNEGTLGDMNSIETEGNASEAASRRFDDEEYEE